MADYGGLCIDGPMKGKWIACQTDVFHAQVAHDLLKDVMKGASEDPFPIIPDLVTYRYDVEMTPKSFETPDGKVVLMDVPTPIWKCGKDFRS